MKKKTIIIVSVLVFIIVAVGSFLAKQYYHITKSNFTSLDKESHAFYVTPETEIETILDSVMVYYEMESKIAWRLTCKLKEFKQIKPGHYKFPAKFSAREIVNRLQYGKETPINLSFTQSIRTREQLAAQMGKKLLLDSA